MKNLIYVFAVLIMGVVSCGAPAEKNTTSDTQEVTSCAADCVKECCAVTEEATSEEATSCEADCTKACCADKEASHDNHEGHSH